MLDQHPITLPVPYEDEDAMDAFDELPHERGEHERVMTEAEGAEVIDVQIADALFTA